MGRTFPGWVLVIVIACTVALHADDSVRRLTFGHGGKTRAYSLYVPETVKQDAEVPLLLTLHGSGRDGASLVGPWKTFAKKEGFIVVGPDSFDKASWDFKNDGPMFLRELVDVVRAQHNVDGRRMYLFGHSGGAIQALEIGLLESEYFAAVAVHAGAIPKEEFHLIEMADRKIPLGIWVGTADRLFPMAAIETTRDALVARGIPIHVRPINNHTHNYYQRSDQVNGEAWAFLVNHKLSADPKFKHYDMR